MTASSQPKNQTIGAPLIAAVLAAAAIGALIVDRSDDAAEPAPDPVTAPAPEPAGDASPNPQEGLPPGHPPLDGAPQNAGPLPPGHPPLDSGNMGHASPHANSAGSAEHAPVGKAPGGVTIAELFAEAKGLEGKTVKLRARIVKSTPNVLGKTWLHVQDGTGEAASNTHDLVVTTQGTPTVGQTVLLEGRVVRDKDLGSGYRYDVLLEEAKILDDAAGEEEG